MIDSRSDRTPSGFRSVCLLLLLSVAAATDPNTVSAQVPTAPLRILLTNDDGFDAPGITALREALIAGGHTVIVVAPSTNQSGSSARRSSGTFHYTEASPGLWHVDGSPADAVSIALGFLMSDSLPDLVVSGTNSGQNIGTSTSHSGTVGAAVTAVRIGIPAVAISAQVPRDGAAAVFESAGRLARDLVDQLVANPTPDGALLPEQMLLNVNYPAASVDEVRGVRFTPVSDASGYTRFYRPTGTTGEVRVGLGPLNPSEIQEGTDVSLLEQGYATINLINANGDAGTASLDEVSRRLDLRPN